MDNTLNTQNFYAGEEFYAHHMLGCLRNESGGATFRTFAPAAEGVELVLNDEVLPMGKVADGNFWEAYVATVNAGDAYEFRIWHGGTSVDHCDPYGMQMELRPAHRSIVADLTHEWHDADWMASRDTCRDKPLNIYELHMGSWRKHSLDQPSEDPADWYTYDELAGPLVEHLTQLDVTHVEFLPLTEYPFDGSWGYQPTGFYAATSRYGTPTQLMTLIDALHQAGIGAILDFVPVHFALDPWALADYDGTPLFEYPNDAVGVSEWGSRNFIHSRGETCSFLQSAANFWLGAYHFDALRLDAISRIIYWQGDETRGINGMAMDFVKTFNSGCKSLNPGTFMVAEDSTNVPGTTKAVEEGGLGFDYKWDMGWMHDTLDLFQKTPDQRLDNYHELTFSMDYFGNERYLLPLSHDEVVHGKATIANKMSGADLDVKLAQARTLYLYMFCHPGKKLNFMGSEVAQLREWDENREQDWFMRQYPAHEAFFQFFCELGWRYRNEPALWDLDYDKTGFAWRESSGQTDVVYAFERTSAAGERLLCAFNLSDEDLIGRSITIPQATTATMLLDTSWQRFGGMTPDADDEQIAIADGTLALDLPAFGGVLLRID
ncbi:MAG: 1,4-alpha-glucan branching protein GlgB [Coriobacteriales bacterium]|nr:1,4-alpha-glucan branching protein GlgB [Coriobacteriales bacterium]